MPRHRIVYLVLAAALTTLVTVTFLIAPEGDEEVLPEPLRMVRPLPGDIVTRQAEVEIGLPVGYSIELYVDGRRVPGHEIVAREPTGRFSWKPAPGGWMERWEAGERTLRLVWDRTTGGRPDPGEFEWRFRVQ